MNRWRVFVAGAHVGGFLAVYVLRRIEMNRALDDLHREVEAFRVALRYTMGGKL